MCGFDLLDDQCGALMSSDIRHALKSSKFMVGFDVNSRPYFDGNSKEIMHSLHMNVSL